MEYVEDESISEMSANEKPSVLDRLMRICFFHKKDKQSKLWGQIQGARNIE